MLANFFRIAFRFLWRNKAYTLLNYLCLTFGLTCSIVAALNVIRVFSYDKFHKNYERIYEVEANVTYFNGDRFPKEVLSASIPDILKADVPEIEAVSRIASRTYTFINGNDLFTENGIYADENITDIFTLPLIEGDPAGILAGTNSIVISEKMATKFFNTTSCIGKTLIINDNTRQQSFTVTGVLEKFPGQSYLYFDFIIPFSKFLMENPRSLDPGADATQVWVLLSENANAAAANAKMKKLISGQESTLNQELFLFPLKEKILYYYADGRRIWREMRNVVVIAALGLAILLIACFNFINLSIAQNIRRYREAGIKKVVGAQRSSIVAQYLGETLIITIISLLTAIDLVRLVLGALNRVFNGNVTFDFSDAGIILLFAGIALFTAVVSGLLPALYLSSSNPLAILKGKMVTRHSFSFFRQSLIVFQFTIPIALITLMIIIKVQDGYMRHFDLGFDKNKLLIISGEDEIQAHAESIRNDLLSIPGIESASFSSCIPARGARVTNDVSWDGKPASEKFHFWCINTDFSFEKTVNIKISDGRYFDRSFAGDSSCFVINDVAAKVMGYDDPVGRTMTLENRKGMIIGVFSGFRTLDLAGPETPTIIRITKEDRGNLLVKLAGDYSTLSGKIREVTERYQQEKPFRQMLYSDLIARTELATVSNLVGLAFLISILLACMGLSGLASFTAASRTKEIGIRKINGATTGIIMRLLGLNFSRWLAVASLISVPLAFLVGNIFLSRFSVRTPFPYWAFLAGPVIAYVIALITVSRQSWKASTRNPVEALRYE